MITPDLSTPQASNDSRRLPDRRRVERVIAARDAERKVSVVDAVDGEMTDPKVGASRPRIMGMVVDLPPPFGPRSQ